MKAIETKLKKECSHFAYHNIDHSKRTAKEAKALFELEKKLQKKGGRKFPLNSSDKKLLMLVAYAHDVIQNESKMGANEKKSAEWLVNEMNSHPKIFSPHEKKCAKIAILGTQTRHKKTQLVQKVSTFKKRKTIDAKTLLFAQLLADADLSNLGSPWKNYFQQMSNFFKESHPKGNASERKTHLKNQIPLLQKFQYHTEAGKKRYHHLKSNAGKIRKLLKKSNGGV